MLHTLALMITAAASISLAAASLGGAWALSGSAIDTQRGPAARKVVIAAILGLSTFAGVAGSIGVMVYRELPEETPQTPSIVEGQ